MAEAKLATIRPAGAVALDPQALIEKAVQAGAGIETMERLVALAKDVRGEQARDAYHAAMAQFQATVPPIPKNKEARIATRNGPGYAYRYADLPSIMATITPVMAPLGLSVSWRSKALAGSVSANCRISHVLGHYEESGDVEMPVGTASDGAGANPAQRVGIAMTYAKRYALLGITGLTPEDDPDAHGVESGDGGEPRAESGGRSAETSNACPSCGVVGAIIQGKPEYGGGWLCYGKKGGCGEKFKADPRTPEGLAAWKEPPFGYEPPADADEPAVVPDVATLTDRLNRLNLRPGDRKALLAEAGLGERADLARVDPAALADLDAALKKRGA